MRQTDVYFNAEYIGKCVHTIYCVPDDTALNRSKSTTLGYAGDFDRPTIAAADQTNNEWSAAAILRLYTHRYQTGVGRFVTILSAGLREVVV